MRVFNDNDFLLMNEYGKRLYHTVAASLPVIDPHNHIDPAALSGNRKFENLYQLWVQNDPYKHRAMRICGIREELITGTGTDYEKFMAWATCLPATQGNPLFHWSCMELKMLFGIHDMLTPSTARQTWDKANELLKLEEFGALNIVRRFGVELLCTSDDLNDTLEHHVDLARLHSGITCLPSLRADSIIGFDQPSFSAWFNKLEAITSMAIVDLETFKTAIIKRLNFFDKAGCLLSDHSFDSGFKYTTCKPELAASLFEKVIKSDFLAGGELISLQSYLLHFLGTEYARRKWKMQLHIGAYRYTSSKLRNKVGPAGGYACIGNAVNVPSLCLFL